MKIQTKDLDRDALNWAVAKCEDGYNFYNFDGTGLPWDVDASNPDDEENGAVWFKPSTNRAQGWPIIEREKISTQCRGDGVWFASTPEQYAGSAANATGPTDLIAGLRCFVDSRLGSEVEVPDELVPHLVAQRAAAQEAMTQHRPIDRPRG